MIRLVAASHCLDPNVGAGFDIGQELGSEPAPADPGIEASNDLLGVVRLEGNHELAE